MNLDQIIRTDTFWDWNKFITFENPQAKRWDLLYILTLHSNLPRASHPKGEKFFSSLYRLTQLGITIQVIIDAKMSMILTIALT